MNIRLWSVVICALFVSQVSAIELKSDKQKLSYAVGLQVADSLKKDGADYDSAVVTEAIKDSMSGGKLQMTEAEKTKVIQAYRDKRAEEYKVVAKKNAKASAAFLSENKKKPGVITLPSGLQYKVITEGKGKKPETDHAVTMNYRGTLTDGTEFDSSYKRGQPAQYSATGVFPGWQEAILLMREGSHWMLYVPPELAFADGGLGKFIGPNQVLVMDVELLKTEKLKIPEQKK